MDKVRKIVIAEDHTILRDGLKSLLAAHPDLEIVGEAEDGREAVRCIDKHKPDLVLMDISMPRMDGIGAIREIRRRCPETRVLVLTVHKEEEYVVEALLAGAHGYILKDATHSELIMAIRNVLGGKPYIGAGISEKLIEGYLEGKKSLKGSSDCGSLTEREREILKLVAEGYRNREIGEYLCISVKTVEKHRANLMKKLGIHNVSSLTAFAIRKGLTTR